MKTPLSREQIDKITAQDIEHIEERIAEYEAMETLTEEQQFELDELRSSLKALKEAEWNQS